MKIIYYEKDKSWQPYMGLKFQQFLEGNSVPPQSVTINGNDIENEDYIQYDQPDQLIIAWLLASMHPTILTQMVGLDSSTAIWVKLQTYRTFHKFEQG